jgi:hypothetical protein
MTGIWGHGGEHLVLVCDDCGGMMDLPRSRVASVKASVGESATGWQSRRGRLGPHFCPDCVVGRGPAAAAPMSP